MGDDVNAIFNALADPSRRTIVETLARREATATQLASELPVTRQAVAKHLGALGAAGLVTATRRGRETRYRLTPAPLADAVAWIDRVGTAWDARLDALGEHLASRGRRSS
jgi:DNA-binding transcriptional ArsR family regulator